MIALLCRKSSEDQCSDSVVVGPLVNLVKGSGTEWHVTSDTLLSTIPYGSECTGTTMWFYLFALNKDWLG